MAWRIFSGIALVVAVVLVVTLAVAYTVAINNANASIQAGLAETNERVFDILSGQRNTMLKLAQQFANKPDFRAAVNVRGARDTAGAYATAFDQSQEADTAIGATRTQILDADGVLVARSDDPRAHGDTLGGALIGGALEGKPTQGFGVIDSTLSQVVAVPIPGAVGSVAGALMAVRKIDDTVATQIGRQTGSELVFYIAPPKAPPAISVTTAKLGNRDVLSPLITRWMTGAPPPGADANDTSAGGSGRMHLMAMGDKRDADIAGRHYVGQRVAALSAGGNEVGGFIALRDRDKELAPFYKLRDGLLIAGAGGLFVAFLLSLLISRQIVRPVRALVGATQRAADGDYDADIPVASGDEIGTLADAFKRLLADLRDKQALVDFLQGAPGGGMEGAASGRTIALRGSMPTMQLQAMGSAALEPGQVLGGRYDIQSVLGVGGMGMVYKASDRELGEPVAIKTLKPDMMEQDSSALERFKSEIRLARKISHRNVVRTYDLGEAGGVYFITMELVEGKSLKELIVSRGRLPASVVLPIAKQLCRALEVAHEEGVIHRDIKPQNMVVQSDGVLKVMDFGIARLARRGEGSGYTQAGTVVGTPEYMAPEQLLGEEIDERADLYSVGVVLYECLTGKMPHTADTPITLIAKVLEETPRPPRVLQPDIPASLSDVVMRTLSKERDARPKSAGELIQLLDRL